MPKVLVTDTNLTNIANAIRSKNGSSDTYKPSEMATAIENIPTGTTPKVIYLKYRDADISALTIIIPDGCSTWQDVIDAGCGFVAHNKRVYFLNQASTYYISDEEDGGFISTASAFSYNTTYYIP